MKKLLINLRDLPLLGGMVRKVQKLPLCYVGSKDWWQVSETEDLYIYAHWPDWDVEPQARCPLAIFRKKVIIDLHDPDEVAYEVFPREEDFAEAQWAWQYLGDDEPKLVDSDAYDVTDVELPYDAPDSL